MCTHPQEGDPVGLNPQGRGPRITWVIFFLSKLFYNEKAYRVGMRKGVYASETCSEENMSTYEIELNRKVREETAEEVKDLPDAEKEYIINARIGQQRARDSSFGGCVFEAEAAAGAERAARQRFGRV